MISKTIHFICILLFGLVTISNAQTKPKTKPPAQSEMDLQMAETMKDMDPEEKAAFQKMMKNMMPATMDKTAPIVTVNEFTSNKELVPKKVVARIAAISKKKLSNADMNTYASTLYTKIMTKGEAAEIALVKSVLPKASKANHLSSASVLAMLQGHPQAAMALSMKAVQMEPTNPNLQNNMASLLTQYGYEEKAIPVLNKLKIEFPDNSTILNNLGQAWFGLGELDSARLFIGMALSANPSYPEALVCGGLIDEIKGDPQKAISEYAKAIEMCPMPVLQKMLKNAAGEKGLEKIDFNKFLKNITIHEYFPKDWITIPKLSDQVNGFEKDISIQNGYTSMFEKLKNNIEELGVSATKETNELLDNEQSDFFKSITIIEESVKGINKMSSTAVVIQTVLLTYMNKWSYQTQSDQLELQKLIESKREELSKSKKDEKCADIDGRNNKYMAYINPVIRDFFDKKIEELRNWLNAYCTWVWYVTGNPKNIVVMSCINQTNALVDLYESAIVEQIATAKSCVNQNNVGSQMVNPPEIPDFNCPTLVSMPVGNEWLQISNATKNLDANSFNIKNNQAQKVPNNKISYSAKSNSILKPGEGHSFISNTGSIYPQKNNNASKIIFKSNCDKSKATKDKENLKAKREKELLKQKTIDLLNSIHDDMDELFQKVYQKNIKEIQKEFTDIMNLPDELYFAQNKEFELAAALTLYDSQIELNELFQKENWTSKDNSKALELAGLVIDCTNRVNSILNGTSHTIHTSVQVPGTFNVQKGLFQ